TRAGFPATITSAGTLLVTTAPAPTIVRSPILTPFRITAPLQIQTSSPITTGELASGGQGDVRRRIASVGWPSESETYTFPARRQYLPIRIDWLTRRPHAWPIKE